MLAIGFSHSPKPIYYLSSSPLQFLLAQYWKIVDGKLFNNLRNWDDEIKDVRYELDDDTNGFIEIQYKSKVFAVKNDTKDIVFETKVTPTIASQDWTLGQENDEGMRTIIHTETGLYLTAQKRNNSTALSLHEEGERTNFHFTAKKNYQISQN